LYAPAEPVIDRVMERVNESFAMIERLYEVAQLLANTVIPRVKDSLVNQTISLQFIQVSSLLKSSKIWLLIHFNCLGFVAKNPSVYGDKFRQRL
jgi:hypothetical protein